MIPQATASQNHFGGLTEMVDRNGRTKPPCAHTSGQRLSLDCFALLTMTEPARDAIAANYDDKLQIDFVLSQYVSQGVEELDQEKLGALVGLKYGSAHEAEPALGSVRAIRDSFVGFQRYLHRA